MSYEEGEIAERIIALDEALDQIILARGEQLAEDIEFAQTAESKKSGVRTAGAITAGLVPLGYAGSVAYRGRGHKGGRWAGAKEVMHGDTKGVRSRARNIKKSYGISRGRGRGVLGSAGQAAKSAVGTKAQRSAIVARLRKLIGR